MRESTRLRKRLGGRDTLFALVFAFFALGTLIQALHTGGWNWAAFGVLTALAVTFALQAWERHIHTPSRSQARRLSQS